MAKVARNIYDFEVNGVEYRASFSHVHMREVPHDVVDKRGTKGLVRKGYRHYEPIRIGTVKAEHVTTCLLGRREQIVDVSPTMSAFIGMATCSVKDEYKRLVGLKAAFERCLQAMGLQFEYVKEGKTKMLRFGSAEDRRVYGVFMDALFTSMNGGALAEVA